MELYAGIDLHSNNNFIQIIDGHDKTQFSKRLPNNIEHILSLQSMISRNLGIKMPSSEIRKLKPGDAHDLFDDDNLASCTM